MVTWVARTVKPQVEQHLSESDRTHGTRPIPVDNAERDTPFTTVWVVALVGVNSAN